MDSSKYSKWGIMQLDKTVKKMKGKLTIIFDKIINDEYVEVE